MSRIELDRQLEELRTAVLQMGESVVASIDQAIEALTHRDHRALDAVIAGDDTIDRECATIEETKNLKDLRPLTLSSSVASSADPLIHVGRGWLPPGRRWPCSARSSPPVSRSPR